MEITVAPGAASERATERAFRAIARVHALMSAHEPTSDLGRLARARPGETIRIHTWTWRVLRRAHTLHQKTNGTFDPIAAAKFAVETDRLPRWYSSGISIASSWSDVRLLSGNRVRLSRPIRFDLGGIAKGFAVDCAIAVLRSAGLDFGLVNAGGDMRAFGSRSWPIHVRKPDAPRELVPVGLLRDGAVATSATYFSRQRQRGVTTSALFAPAVGRSITGKTSATVFAPTCLLADALTKVLLCGGDSHTLRTHRAHALLLTGGEGGLRAA